jgi:hypothetical protein
MVAILCGCEADKVTPPSPASQNPYKALTSKDDVLYNLELLYPLCDTTEYKRVLDDDLIFYFSDADIWNGIPFTEFDKQQELKTLRNMADENRPDRVLSIELTLSYSEEEWNPITPEEPAYSHETWYQKTVGYDMTVQAEPDMTYTSYYVLDAQITVREGEDKTGTKIWRIIRWRDAIEGGSTRSLVAGGAQIQLTTWGAVKALYN